MTTSGCLSTGRSTEPQGLAGAVELDADARAAIIRLSSGDARRALTALESAALGASAAREGDAIPVVTAEIVARAVDRALLRYDRQGDEHYDVISAFIKSVRGSDVDAALHYLARMIEAGEDPRFIARRVMISAAEDVGMADPQALLIAVAAADAVQLIGMPEGRIPLAEAVVYLATAPKSNAAYVALDAAIADVRAGKIGRVPKHLGTRTTREPSGSGTARGISTPTMRSLASPSSSIFRTSSWALSTTPRRRTATSATSRPDWKSCARLSAADDSICDAHGLISLARLHRNHWPRSTRSVADRSFAGHPSQFCRCVLSAHECARATGCHCLFVYRKGNRVY